MKHEPMTNLREKAPLYLAALLFILHILRVHIIGDGAWAPLAWLVLFPLGVEGISISQNITSLFGHSLLHADYGHVLMNGGGLVIFGTVTLDAIRGKNTGGLSPNMKFLLIFAFGVIGGGLFQWGHWALTGELGRAIGASGGVSAFFATMGYALGGREKMLRFGGAWIVLQLAIAFLGDFVGMGNVAWAAHIGGLVGGMIIAPMWLKPAGSSFSINR